MLSAETSELNGTGRTFSDDRREFGNHIAADIFQGDRTSL